MTMIRLVEDRILCRDVLKAVMSVQNYWVFGLFAPSGILKSTKEYTVLGTHTVSETLYSVF
jgi:hypothetical protein